MLRLLKSRFQGQGLTESNVKWRTASLLSSSWSCSDVPSEKVQVQFSTNCWKVRTCKYLLPSSCSSQLLRTTRSRNWGTRRCFCFFIILPTCKQLKGIYALCNYLVKQPQMKTYLIFYFLFHTEPTGLLQLESDCTKAPNPNQKSLTNIHSMNNKRYEALLDGSYFCWTSMENADFKCMYKIFVFVSCYYWAWKFLKYLSHPLN